MNHDEIVSGLILELRRGTLILLVLSQLKEPMYGYNLVKKLRIMVYLLKQIHFIL